MDDLVTSPLRDGAGSPLRTIEDEDLRSTATTGWVGPSPSRWLVLIAFSFMTGLNSLMWITFAPIRDCTAKKYGVGGVAVDWLSMSFMLSYPLIVIPMSHYIEASPQALQRGLRVSAGLNLLGAGVRLLSVHSASYEILLLGQTITSCGQGFTLGAPPRISGTWFPETEWGLSTGLGVLANQLGPAVAFTMVPLMVDSSTGRGLRTLLLVELLLAVLSGTLVLSLIPQRPPCPPSAVAAERRDDDGNNRTLHEAFAGAWEALTTARDLRLLNLGYGLAVGTLYSFETLLSVLLPAFSTNQVSTLGTAALLAGLPGSVLGGFVLDKTRKYKGTTLLLTVSAALSMAAFTVLASGRLGVVDSPPLLAAAVVVSCWLSASLCAVLSAGFECVA